MESSNALMPELLAKYRRLLSLNDWEIFVHEIEGMSNMAETKSIYNDYQAIIKIQKELSDAEKEKTLIHELLHLIFRDAYDIFDELVKDEFANGYCHRQHERAIEKTAKIIYSLIGETNAGS